MPAVTGSSEAPRSARPISRSEERRVGKECRGLGETHQEKKKKGRRSESKEISRIQEEEKHTVVMINNGHYPLHSIIIFFFQAEDGIRDYKVTGVQTCALPI